MNMESDISNDSDELSTPDNPNTFSVLIMTQREDNEAGEQYLVNDVNNDLIMESPPNQNEIEYLETDSADETRPKLIEVDIQSKLFEDYTDVYMMYKCKKCSYKSTDYNLFNNHILTHIFNTNVAEGEAKQECILLCSYCQKAFSSSDDIKKHMIIDHSLEEEHEKKVKKQSTMNIVIESNDSKLGSKKKRKKSEIIQNVDPLINTIFNLSCTVAGCNIKLANKDDLEVHEKCHGVASKNHSKSKRVKHVFNCYICNETFSIWSGCSMHLYKLHKISCGLLNCPVCKTYKTPILLRLENHLRIHSDMKAFACRHCGKTFKQATQLRNHNVIHIDKDKDTTPKWYTSKQCNICFKMYSDAKCLKKHKEEVHVKLRPFVCNVCGHASARKGMLELHQRQHNGHKPFQCTLCEFKTSDHNSFRRHVMRHTGVRPYKCPHCDYSAIQSGSYKNHIKLMHPQSKGIFSCDLCSYVTVSEDNYVRHISDHLTGVITVLELTEDQTTSNTKTQGATGEAQEVGENDNNSKTDAKYCFSQTADEDVIDQGGITIPA